MDFLLQICCIFPEHLFLKTPLGDCFWRWLDFLFIKPCPMSPSVQSQNHLLHNYGKLVKGAHKNICKYFFNFWALFLRLYLFWGCDFFSSLILIQSTKFVSVADRIYNVLVNDKPLFSSLHHEKWESTCFLVYHWNKFLQHNYAAYQQNYAQKWS